LLELPPQLTGEAVEVLGGDDLESAPGQFLFDALEVGVELRQFGLMRSEEFLLQRFQFHRLEARISDWAF